jgi:hypothetical protein
VPADASLSLSWKDAGGAVEFQARVLLNGIEFSSSAWQPSISWQPGSLPPGSYTWPVRGRNGSADSGWSTARALTITTASPLPTSPTLTPPLQTRENNGLADRHRLDQSNSANHTDGGAISWKYACHSSTTLARPTPVPSPRSDQPAGRPDTTYASGTTTTPKARRSITTSA